MFVLLPIFSRDYLTVLVDYMKITSDILGWPYEFVYVIGLHAVQFGNNWMKKIPRIAKIGCQRNFLNPIISKLDKHVVLLLINYIAREVIQLCKTTVTV